MHVPELRVALHAVVSLDSSRYWKSDTVEALSLSQKANRMPENNMPRRLRDLLPRQLPPSIVLAATELMASRRSSALPQPNAAQHYLLLGIVDRRLGLVISIEWTNVEGSARHA